MVGLMKTVMLLILSLSVPAAAQYRKASNGMALPGAATPGITRKVTVDQLCNPNFHTASVRDVTEAEKKQVCAVYAAKDCPGAAYEIDHLVSLEIGGDNVAANLWPQPIAQARHKDVIENQLHRFVCSAPRDQREMRLHQAQDCIKRDWTSCADVMAEAGK